MHSSHKCASFKLALSLSCVSTDICKSVARWMQHQLRECCGNAGGISCLVNIFMVYACIERCRALPKTAQAQLHICKHILVRLKGSPMHSQIHAHHDTVQYTVQSQTLCLLYTSKVEILELDLCPGDIAQSRLCGCPCAPSY